MTSKAYSADCIFCKIAAGEIPSDTVFEDDSIVVFADINPATPVHYLVIPKAHIISAAELGEENIEVVGRMIRAANTVAREKGVAESGYRLCINTGKDAGQEVPHLHMHLMGGRPLGWNH